MEKSIQLLHELGLTSLQAKIYLTLIETGKEKALVISKESNTDRANTYQTLRKLHKMGLVEKILGKPNLYAALPLQEATAVMLKHKKNEYNNLQKAAETLLQKRSTKEELFHDEIDNFMIVKHEKETELKRVAHVCEMAQKSIDLLLNKKTFLAGMIDLPRPHIESMRRGVKYRVVIEKTNQKLNKKALQAFMKEPTFQIRYIPYTPNVEICITDNKTAGISLVPDKGIGERPTLQTTHKGCVEMFQVYFDRVWDQARKHKPYDVSSKRKSRQTITCQS